MTVRPGVAGGPGWRVIHSVPVGHDGSDIDHLVVLVNGQRTVYLRNSRFEARRASSLLTRACGFPVAVHPGIVVLAARLAIREQPRDVHVVDDRTLVRWLSRKDAVLCPGDVEAIFEQARRDATWRTPAR